MPILKILLSWLALILGALAKRNIIMLVTDGTGPASINLARSYNQYVNNNQDLLLELDRYLVGTSRTRSSSSLITDSAAGATAFSCALKSYNGAISVDPHQRACYTVLEALKAKGYKTGLVVTTGITDATPAAFNAHAESRAMQSEIASQQMGIGSAFGHVTDLMIGGGACFYSPGTSAGGCRSDEEDLFAHAEKLGWNVAKDRATFDSWDMGANVSLPLLALHAFYNVPYEIDRDPAVHPSLYEQTQLALNVLSEATKDSEEGFFLMVEGSRIDHAGHHNDAAAQVREVLAYDKAFAAVVDFVDSSDVDTIMVATSDHETGGLTVGRQLGEDYPEYVWFPRVLDEAQASGEKIGADLVAFLNTSPSTKQIESYVADTIFTGQLGLKAFHNDELTYVLDMVHRGALADTVEYCKDMIAQRAHVGWTTHGHTGVDVNIYAHANTPEGKALIWEELHGARENTEVGAFLAKVGDVSIGQRLDYKWGQEAPSEVPADAPQRVLDYVTDIAAEADIEALETREHGFGAHMLAEPHQREV